MGNESLSDMPSARFFMLRKVMLVCVCCLLITSVAMGQNKLVKLKTGGQIIGVVKEIEGGYEIKTKVGTIVVAKDQVVSIEDIVLPEDEYKQRLKKIDPKNPEDHFKLAEWAVRNNFLEAAEQHLQTALKLRPDYEEAQLLLKLVKDRIAAIKAAKIITRPTTRPAKHRKDFLKLRDINRLRLVEMVPGEYARVTFRNDVINRFIKAMAKTDDFRDDPQFARKFRRARPQEQLAYILRKIDPASWSLKDDIIIRTDPAVFKTFRNKVWPIVLRSCASGSCHGGPKGAGQLKLFSVSRNDTTGIYTNFLILDMFKKGGRSMLYRDHVEQSLLLEYGLDPKHARYRHPTEIAPIFKDVTNPRYKVVMQWIDSLGGPPHPDYGVKYKPPFGPKIDEFDPLRTPKSKKSKPSPATTSKPAEVKTTKPPEP